MFDRRLVTHFDWGLLGLTVLLGGVGILTLYSAVSADNSGLQKVLYLKQSIWFGAGMLVMCLSFMFNYKLLDRWATFIYLGSLILLVCVLIFGKHVGGSRRWLVMGPISVQPSELVKITIIICMARYCSKVGSIKGLGFRELLMPLFFILPVFWLIVKQPDLGTALLLLLIAASMTLFVKIEKRTLISLAGAGITVIPLVWFFLKGYQKQRILTFLNPERDPLGSGYHIIQSKIAIGSGMLTGKGYLQGTQNALSFLPEQHTDFIFSVLAEEWGLLGGGLVLITFLILILWGLNIAYGCRDPFGTILCIGVSAMLSWQVFINVGMVMGLMPVVGVPLPFISYGGSSVITTMTGIGLLMNVSMRRFLYE